MEQISVNTPRYEAGKFAYGAMIEEGTANILTANQASVETDLSGLNAYSQNSQHTLSRDTSFFVHGVASAKLVSNYNGSQWIIIIADNPRTHIYGSADISGSLWTKASDVYSGAIKLDFYDSGNNYISTSPVWFTHSTTWQRVSIAVTSPDNAAYASLVLSGESMPQNAAIWWDCAQIEQKAYATSWQLPGVSRGYEYINLPTSGIFEKSNWTVELTFTPIDVMNKGYVIKTLWCCKIDAINFYALCVGMDGKLLLRVRSNGTTYNIETGSALTIGNSYSIMACGDGSKIRLFCNGSQLGTDQTYVEPVGALPDNMYIGYGYDKQANGILENMRFTSRARTLSEYQAWWNNGNPKVFTVDADTSLLIPFDNTLDSQYPTIHTGDVMLDGFEIEQVLGHEQDTCSLVLKSGEKPTEGQEIVISDGETRIFAGIITAPKDEPKTPDITFYDLEAVDYGYMLDRRLVVETYENISASSIVMDIINNYCPGFTGNGVVSGALEVEYIKLDYERPTEAFKQLADYVGWKWYVDYYKDVQFFENYNAYAPEEINSSTAIRKLKHDIDIQGLRNRVFVLGGKFLSDFQTFEYVADGKERVWVLPHEPHSPSVEVSEVSKTIGLESVDDEASYDYMYNQREKYIRCSVQTATPSDGATMSFTYKIPMDVITMVEDMDSQQAIAAIQGGDGIYEHKIVDDSLITIEAAEAAGQADLAEYANPQVKGSFETEIAGFAPGQLLTINLPQRGINNQFIIQKVNISTIGNKLIYKVSYGGE
jgi:hypothetical protein